MKKPQKAKHFYLEAEKKTPAYLGSDYMIFEKHDGWYGYMDGHDSIRSRNLRQIPSMQWLSDELRGKFDGRLIFEIMVKGSPVFKDLNGILNRHAQAKDAYILIHDYVSKNDTSMPFEDRYKLAAQIADMLDLPLARLISRHSSHEDWQRAAKLVWAAGGEGIVMKDRRAPYSYGSRIGSLLKIKEEVTLNCHVVGVVEGEGKYEGMLGALSVKDDNGILHAIGGMTDYERAEWWRSPRTIIGKVVEVKAMKRLANGSLREPRFKAIRYDLS